MTALPAYTEVAMAFNVQHWPKLRQMACGIATRQIMELHKHGRFEPGIALLGRLVKRWKLGDYV